jgi:hypothetical protein
MYELHHVLTKSGPRDGGSICCVVATTSDFAVRIIINLFSFLAIAIAIACVYCIVNLDQRIIVIPSLHSYFIHR